MPTPRTPCLHCDRITKSFGRYRALNAVDFRVEAGEVHALIGENGAGKSTLAGVILGTVRPDAGRLLLDGNEIVLRSARQALDLGITGMTQEPSAVENLTVIQNVFLGLEKGFWGRSRLNPEDRYDTLCRQTGWWLPPDLPTTQLSIADRQKTELLRCLNRNPRLLILDEPTAALDPTDTRSLLAQVRTLRQQGRSIVYISHALDEVLEVADTISILRGGHLTHHLPATKASLPLLVDYLSDPHERAPRPPRESTCPVGREALRIEQLHHKNQLTGLSLTVRQGEIVGLISDNAASTQALASVLTGRTHAEQGTIFLSGRPVRLNSPAAAFRHGIATIPADREREALLPGRSIAENICIPHLTHMSRFGLISHRTENTRTNPLRTALNITAPPDAPIETLSGGNRQKAVVARCLLQQPAVLIAHHPTRGVDLTSRATIHHLLHHLTRNGSAVLLVSDDVGELLELADRILVLRHGTLTHTHNRPLDLTTRDLLADVFESEPHNGTADREP